MTLGDLMAVESRWPVLIVLVALGVVELFGVRGTKASRARRAEARRAFEEHTSMLPRPPINPRPPPDKTRRNVS
ncbi:hypothetical protein LO772_20295 [Yinghuangia sp. ASG 101]|uniref:hypothetical protein n=1 Tax=Yinghuangia sp. ASG 101 TaxID=2896848 RepID=UPI001E3F1737|nr:hypothetical protein [Yinghuangia sp. ASG 101]UGQ09286.1 hypothetical protein LO772_20295 [Yinghuangia sp. ASG 101]